VDERLIFWPAVAMVVLTFIVQWRMFVTRVAEIRREGIRIRDIATSPQLYARLKDVKAADNFRNLFELPVLFYLALVVAFLTAQVNVLTLSLAWAFCVSRVAHSVIQCGYNRVRDRFYAYLAGTVLLWVFWAVLAFGLLK
jgi:hypothetical protein